MLKEINIPLEWSILFIIYILTSHIIKVISYATGERTNKRHPTAIHMRIGYIGTDLKAFCTEAKDLGDEDCP
jgi:hypothetical protein